MKLNRPSLTEVFLHQNTDVNDQPIEAVKAKQLMNRQDTVIIDVREAEEYKKEHIQNALLIPLSKITKANSDLPEKYQTVLVYCRSGGRSQKAATKLFNMGYKKVYNIGGIIDWPYEIEK